MSNINFFKSVNKNSFMNKYFLFALKFIFSLLILAYLFTFVPFTEILTAIKSAEGFLVTVAIFLALPINYFSAYETHYLTRIQGISISVFEILKIHLITGFYGLFLPGMISGGAVKWYKFTKHGSKSSAAAVVVFNRFLEMLITVLLGIVFLIPALYDPGEKKLIIFWTLLFSVLVLLYFFLLNSRTLKAIREIILRFPLPNIIKEKTIRFFEAMHQFQNLKLKDHLEILGLLLLYHGLGIISFYCFAKSLNINLSIWVIGWVRSVMAIAVMFPFSFAGFGIREATLVFLLGQYGVSPGHSIALSFLIFSRRLLSDLLGGIFELLPSKQLMKTELKTAGINDEVK